MNGRNKRSFERGKNSGKSAGRGREGQSFGRGTEVVGRAEWKLAEAVREFGRYWLFYGGIHGTGAEEGGAEGDRSGKGDEADEGAAEV